MKKLLAAGAALLTVLVLSGCGSSISEGTVTSKDYDPEYQYITMQCMSYNKDGMCTVQIPVTHTYPESWTLNLRDGDKEGYVNVSPGEYESYKVGDHYPQESETDDGF